MQAGIEGANPQIEKLLGQSDDLWERIRAGFAMPDLDRKLVAQQVAWYAARPELFQAIALRARPYLHFIVDEVERRGLPMELALLPFIESGFNPMALSPAQASGLWQFIPETGTRYRLAQNTQYDGRRDVVASTNAALDYLEFLYRHNHRDWHRALASYNWGEVAVARAVERNRARGIPDAYDSLTMPDETRNYVPRLLAVKRIIMDPATYGLQLPEIANSPAFVVVSIPDDIDLALAARLAGTALPDFLALNPAFNSGRAPGATGAGLVIPAEKSDAFRVNLERHRAELAHRIGVRASHTKASRIPARN
ncbi:MAG: transglycosylase SLT domain-containing protein [Betaproteobacteria bacterium]